LSIDSTYRELLIDEFIKNKLTRGRSISAVNVQKELTSLVSRLNLAVPQFSSELYTVQKNEPSSARKFKQMLNIIRQDLTSLYMETLSLTEISAQASTRWRLESELIEKKLIDLEERIENLLILTKDSEGYHSIVVDNFTDNLLIDKDLTTANIDLLSESVRISSTGNGFLERIPLNNLRPEDISFKIRNSYQGNSGSPLSDLRNPFHQETKSWWNVIQMSSSVPVTVELTVKLTDIVSIPVSRIVMKLKDASESSPVTITPLLSLDNGSFRQIPSNSFTQSVRTKAEFQFPEQQVKYIKFICTKEGPDPSGGIDLFNYEFGFDEIIFYREAFSKTAGNLLYSKPLSITGQNGSPLPFERMTLETCERIEANTGISYSVTTGDTSTLPVNASTVWTPISPINRANPQHSQVLTLGNTVEKTLGIAESVALSHDSSATVEDYINPNRNFHIVSLSPGTENFVDTEIDSAKASTVVRYSFKNSNERILNYQIQDQDYGSTTGIEWNDNSLTIFRYVGAQGLQKYVFADEV
jgi:hypothetical protein